MGFGVLGLASTVSDFGFRFSDFGFRVPVFGLRVSSFEFRVSGFEFRVKVMRGPVSKLLPLDVRPRYRFVHLKRAVELTAASVLANYHFGDLRSNLR